MDPTPGGSQIAYIYADGSDKFKTSGAIANPNNYLIVPANYTEQQARDFAARITNAINQASPEDVSGGLANAMAQMRAFRQKGSQDLQRHPQWGIPEDSVVPAFVSSASYHLGSVTRQAGISREWSEIGGGIANLENRYIEQPWNYYFGNGKWNPIDTSGNIWGLSKQNYDNDEVHGKSVRGK